MSLGLLRYGSLTAIWWAVVWYVLPVDLRSMSVPTLVMMHIGPPLVVMSAWSMIRRLRSHLHFKREKKAEAAKVAAAKAEDEAARAAHQAELDRRRAHVDCRGAWMVVPEAPEWYEGGPAQCLVLEQGEEEIEASLQQVLEVAFMQSEGAAYLPLYLLPRRDVDGGSQLEEARQAWRQAYDSFGFADKSIKPDCKFLPGSGDIASRVIAVFEGDPDLPALLLAGADAVEGGAADDADDDEQQAKHAVVALLFSRPGLALPAAPPPRKKDEADPHTPYWESDHGRGPDAPGWGRVPVPLRPGIIALPPFAVLPRARVASLDGAAGKSATLARLLHGLVDPLLVDAGLRDLPYAGDAKPAPEADKAAGEAEPDAAPPLELGWLVHNSGPLDDREAGTRLAAVTAALKDFGCELDPIAEAGNASVEHGDSGAARGALMLAEALIRTAQLQKPVLVAEFDGPEIGVGMTCPPPETNA